METPAYRPPRYWSLDIVRGVCALTVFLNHWVLWSNFAPAGRVEILLHQWLGYAYAVFVALAWPTGGQHPAVVCFFVLSGFCVHGMMERRIGQPGGLNVNWPDYYRRRAWRILPVYWTGCLIGLLFVAAMVWRPVADALLELHAAATPAGVAARLGGYSGLWPHEIFAGNYILATVAVEMIFYAIYPLFYQAAAAGRWLLLGLVAVVLHFVALALQPYVSPFVLFPGVLIMALFWYLGALAVHWREKFGWQVRGWWLGAAWAVFLALGQLPYIYGRNLVRQGVYGLLCMGLLVWLLDWEKRNAARRGHAWSRLLQWFGALSYSLYAVHTPVVLLVNWALLTIVGCHSYAWQLTANLSLSLAVTVLVHRFIEQGLLRPRPPG